MTTILLQSNRAVLAQWPLKSIRSYESSEQGQLSIEAGRVAPMGDGLYIYRTEPGDDNLIYDLIDRYVLDALEQVQVSGKTSYFLFYLVQTPQPSLPLLLPI